MLAEATDVQPGARAVVHSPNFPDYNKEKCLYFQYNLYGEDASTLFVKDDVGVTLWRKKFGRSLSIYR